MAIDIRTLAANVFLLKLWTEPPAFCRSIQTLDDMLDIHAAVSVRSRRLGFTFDDPESTLS